MPTYGSDVRQQRALARIIEDSVSIFQQDASEYAFAGLVGAATGCLLTLILVSIGGSVGAVLLPVLLIATAVLTLATVTEALRRVTDNLEPSAAESFTAVLRGAPAILVPWVTLTAVLAAALLADVHFGHYLPGLARGAAELLVVVFAAYTALTRILAVPALVMRRSSAADALHEGRELYATNARKVTYAWGVCLAPVLLLFLIAALSGFGPVSSAIAALAFVGVLPFAAVVNALLFFDGIAVTEAAPKRATARARTTGLRAR
jgi:hypothetical protein